MDEPGIRWRRANEQRSCSEAVPGSVTKRSEECPTLGTSFSQDLPRSTRMPSNSSSRQFSPGL